MPGDPQATKRGEVVVWASVRVPLPPEAAFRLFTDGINQCWPLHEGYSYGGDRAREIFLEPVEGGRFYERSWTATSSRSAPSGSARPPTASCSPGGAPTGRRRPRSRFASSPRTWAPASSWSTGDSIGSLPKARRSHGDGPVVGHGSSGPSPPAPQDASLPDRRPRATRRSGCQAGRHGELRRQHPRRGPRRLEHEPGSTSLSTQRRHLSDFLADVSNGG